jgi:hypothetical protein
MVVVLKARRSYPAALSDRLFGKYAFGCIFIKRTAVAAAAAAPAAPEGCVSAAPAAAAASHSTTAATAAAAASADTHDSGDADFHSRTSYISL